MERPGEPRPGDTEGAPVPELSCRLQCRRVSSWGLAFRPPTDESEPGGSRSDQSLTTPTRCQGEGSPVGVKIPELERTSRGTKLGASHPSPEPFRAPGPLPQLQNGRGSRAPSLARLRRDARRDRGSSAGIARGPSPSPAASGRLPLPSGRGDHAARGPVLQAAQEPRSEREQGGQPALPSLSGLLGRGHLGSLQWPRAERSSSRAQPESEAQPWRGINADSPAAPPLASNFSLNLAARGRAAGPR